MRRLTEIPAGSGGEGKWFELLQTYEREISELERELVALQSMALSAEDDVSAREVAAPIVYVNARLLKLRIALALLLARRGVMQPTTTEDTQ